MKHEGLPGSAGWAAEARSSPAPLPRSARPRPEGRLGAILGIRSPSARAGGGNEPEKERKENEKEEGGGVKKGRIYASAFLYNKECEKADVVQRKRLHPARIRCLLSRLACPAVLQPRPKPFLLLGSSQRPQPRRDGGSARAPRGSTWPLSAPPALCPQRAPQTSVFRSKTQSANPSLPPSQYAKAKVLLSYPRGFPVHLLAKSHNKPTACKEGGL